MSHYEEKVNENFIELKRKNESHMNRNTIISIIYTITIALGILVCCICDVAISGRFTWSLIVLNSALLVWVVYFLYAWLKERKLLATGITFLLTIPFVLLINITLSRMIGETAVDIWNAL